MSTKYDILVEYLNECAILIYNDIADNYKKHIKKTHTYELKENELSFYKERWKQVYYIEQCIKVFKDINTPIEEKEDMYNIIIENNFKNIQ